MKKGSQLSEETMLLREMINAIRLSMGYGELYDEFNEYNARPDRSPKKSRQRTRKIKS
jgi:hypothetical protein